MKLLLSRAAAPWKDSTTLYRVWKIETKEYNGIEFPLKHLKPGEGAELLEDDEGLKVEDTFIETGDAFVVEFKDNDEWLVAVDGEEPKTEPIFGPGNFFDSLSTGRSLSYGAGPSSFKSSGISLGPSSTRRILNHTPGTMGLTNLYG